MAALINGKEISAQVREEVLRETELLKKKGILPGLAVVIVGEDPASRIYVNNKKKACEACGIQSFEYALPADTSQEDLIALVQKLNRDTAVDGILVQLPLPGQIQESAVIQAVSPSKDVDAFHPENVGRIMAGSPLFLPCTPAGIMELLSRTGISPQGKECVVIGRSNIVGKPMAMLLLHADATVTICHSKTKNLAGVCRRADILISAVGKAGFVTADMVKPGAVVIDVGMNHDANGKLCGDVNFSEVEPIAGYLTPVPGGVGPMTIAMLMKNTLASAKIRAPKE